MESPPPESEASSSEYEHPMKSALDDGELTSSCQDRDFTTFLDLQNAHHSEFINLLKECVQTYGSRWKEIRDSVAERRRCAERFTEDHGTQYWGTPLNRAKYLSPQSLKKPDQLCTYPERQEEIIRAVAILLERKAKMYCKSSEKQEAKPTAKPASIKKPTPAAKGPKVPPASAVTIRHSKKRDEHKKRRHAMTDVFSDASNEDFYKPIATSSKATTSKTTAKEKSNPSTSSSIRSFNSILANVEHEPAKPRPAKKSRIIPPASKMETDNTPVSSVAPSIENHVGPYESCTKFFVSASNQQMAPVWVPFQNFHCSSAFLEQMWAECRLPETDSDPQGRERTSKQMVIAASAKFEWSGLEIRIRHGQDGDLKYISEELEKVWKAKEEGNSTSGLPEFFKIFLMLHIIG